MLSDPEPDSRGEGAFRLAMPRDWPVKHNKRLQVKLPCMNRVVLFAVNEMLQGPEQSRGRKTRSALRLNSNFLMIRGKPEREAISLYALMQ